MDFGSNRIHDDGLLYVQTLFCHLLSFFQRNRTSEGAYARIFDHHVDTSDHSGHFIGYWRCAKYSCCLGGTSELQNFLTPVLTAGEGFAKEMSSLSELWLMIVAVIAVLTMIVFAWMKFVKKQFVPSWNPFSNLFWPDYFIENSIWMNFLIG